MSDATDIRWRQRLNQFSKALAILSEAAASMRQRPLSRLEKLGAIKAFEFTYDLAWNVMKDFFAWQGNVAIMGSRDATREAFAKGLIENGEAWMEMIPSRNQTAHTYNEQTADDILTDVVNVFFPPSLSPSKPGWKHWPMNNLETGLSDHVLERLRGVFATCSAVEDAVLYGSRAMGTARAGSDIDLTLKGRDLTHRDLLELANRLDDLLLPYKIDLSLYDRIDNPALR